MSYELIDKSSYIHIRFFDILESKDFSNLFVDFKKYENTNRIMPHRISTLCDITDCIIQFSKMVPIADSRGLQFLSSKIKSAIVASRPMDIAVANTIKSLNSNPQIDIEIFMEFSEAVNWVNS